MRPRTLCLTALAVVAGLACPGKEVTGPSPVASIGITGAPGAPLRVGQTLQLTATPRDAGGNAVSDPVTWNSRRDTVAAVTTGGLVTALRPGSAWIIATAAAARDSVAVSVVAAVARVDRIGGDGQADTIGATLRDTLVLRAVDAGGQGVAGVPVIWPDPSSGTLSPLTAATGPDGYARARWTLGTAAGPARAIAQASGVTIEWAATVRAGAPASLTSTGDGQSAAAGQPLADSLAVRVRDRAGNAVSEMPVAWSATAGTVTPPAGARTAGDGYARARWVLGMVVGAQRASASVTGLPVVSFGATASLPAVALERASGDGQTGVVATPLGAPLVARVSAGGQPVAGVIVQWTSTGGTFLSALDTSDANGLVEGRWALGTTAGRQVATVAVKDAPAPGVTIEFAATAHAGATSRIAQLSGGGQSGVAGQPLLDSLVVQVTDAWGNPVAQAPVSFAPSSGTASPASAATAADGSARTRWTLGAAQGPVTLDASVPASNGTLTTRFTATAAAPAAGSVEYVSGRAQTDTIGATLTTPLAVLVRDVLGAPKANVAVTWTVLSGGGQVAGASSATSTSDASGVARIAWTLGTAAGSQQVSASVPGLPAVGFQATATPGAVASVVLENPAASGIAGQPLADSIVARVTDRAGNAKPGVLVSFSVLSGGGSVSPSQPATDANGRARTRWVLGALAGSNSLRASAAGVASPPITVVGAPGAVASLAIVAGRSQTGTVGQPLADSIGVVARDAYGNPVPGATVTFAASDGGSAALASKATGSDGIARTRWTLGTVATTQTLTASATGVPAATVTAVASAGAATNLVSLTSGPLGADVGQALADSLAVKVTDAYGNVKAGAKVAWRVTRGGGTIAPDTAVAAASGIAKARWTMGATPGLDSAVATLVGGTATLGFGATASALAVAQLSASRTDTLSANPGYPVADTLVVRATAANGAGIAGVAVTWSAATGGAAQVLDAVTRGDGTARALWTFGRDSSIQRLTASAGSLSASFVGRSQFLVPDHVEFSPNTVSLDLFYGETTLLMTAYDADNRVVYGVDLDISLDPTNGRYVVEWENLGYAGAQGALTTTSATSATSATSGPPSARRQPKGLPSRGLVMRGRDPRASARSDAIAPAPARTASLAGSSTRARSGQQIRVRALSQGQNGVIVSDSAAGVLTTNMPNVVVNDPIRSVAIDNKPDSIVLQLGDSVRLSARTYDARGNALGNSWAGGSRQYAWSSTNDIGYGVLSISQRYDSAVVHASNAGRARVEVDASVNPSGTVSDQLVVRVIGPATSLQFASQSVSVGVGKTAQLHATGIDAGGQPVSHPLQWTSEDPAVVTVNATTGVITGVAIGTASVRATMDGATDWVQVTVGSVVASVVVTAPTGPAIPRERRALTARAYDGSGSLLVDRQFTWTSLTPAVATVDAFSGVVTGVANGTATIRAESEGVQGSTTVTVGQLRLATLGAGSGAGHFCGITAERNAYCWGFNASGQLGDGTNRNSPYPVRAFEQPAYAIATSAYGTCALDAAGAAWCWGEGHAGADLVPDGHTFTSLAAGNNFFCGLAQDGTIWCWGYNSYGLGDGSSTSAYYPVRVSGNASYVSVVAGERHACALTTTGAVDCWGDNGYRALGTGTTAYASMSPVRAFVGPATAITSGDFHICALGASTAGGAPAVCWGASYGNGSSTYSSSPVTVQGGLLFSSLTAGRDFTCGIVGTGDAYCWGADGYGTLGNDPTTASSLTPVLVAGQYRWSMLRSNYYSTCGITTNGATYCWGGIWGPTGVTTTPTPEQLPGQ